MLTMQWENFSLDPAKIPPPEGYSRHQYFLVVDKKDWNKLNTEQKNDLLNRTLGSDFFSCMLTEKVRDDDKFIAYRYWLDLEYGIFPYNGQTAESYKAAVEKQNGQTFNKEE